MLFYRQKCDSTISDDFVEQTEISEKLYGMNLQFDFTKKAVEKLLNSEAALYIHLK